VTQDVDRAAYPFAGHYVDEGAGSPVVLVHGTPTWSFEWRHVIRALAPFHRVIAPDHLGFGLSERPHGAPYSPEWHAGNFDAFIERVAPGPLTLVVHDFGGPIALPLALRRPDLVARVVVVNSWMWSVAGDPAMERAAKVAGSGLGRWLYRWANFSLRVLLPGAYGDRHKLTPDIHRQYLDRFPDRWSRGAVLWPLAKSLLESSAHFASLWDSRAALASRPALVIWGMKDSAFPPSQLARWRTGLPHATIVEINGAGHWPHEEEPAKVIAALATFLNGGHDE